VLSSERTHHILQTTSSIITIFKAFHGKKDKATNKGIGLLRKEETFKNSHNKTHLD
jgi:hypothetical protein